MATAPAKQTRAAAINGFGAGRAGAAEGKLVEILVFFDLFAMQDADADHPAHGDVFCNRKNARASDFGGAYGLTAPLTLFHGPVTSRADCRTPSVQVSVNPAALVNVKNGRTLIVPIASTSLICRE